MASLLRMLGIGPKKAELLKTSIMRTTFRLQAPTTWDTFAQKATSALHDVAASMGTPAPQAIVQMKSEHEGALFLLAPAGSPNVEALAKQVPSYSSVVEACMLPGSAITDTHSGYCWKWADAPGNMPVTVTSTCFDIREGAFEAFVAQFEKESHQLRPHVDEVGLLWQATYEPAKGKATLLSTFVKGKDGPKRMGPKLPELYTKMGLVQFLTAKPLINTSEHGSYLAPVDCDGLSVSA